MFFTVADSVTSSDSVGDAGSAVTPVTVRFGPAAGAPNTCSSATWPLPAPVLAVNRSRTSRAVPETGTVTVLPVAGENACPADPASVSHASPDPVRPCTWDGCVRGPRAAAGGSRTTTASSSAAASSVTASVLGYCPPAPSQYVAVSPSVAFPATYVHSVDDAAAGRPAARSVPSTGPSGSAASRVPRTSSSESCPAGQPVFAVIATRT